MLFSRILRAIFFVFLSASAQAADPKPVTELDEMKWLIGKWRIETTILPGDNDDMGKPGDKLTIDLDYRRFNESTFFEQVIYAANGKTRNVRLNVMAVDRETNTVTLWDFDPNFTTKGQVQKVSDKEYRILVTGVNKSGKEVSFVMVWKILDDSTFTNQFTNYRLGNKSFLMFHLTQ